MSGLTADHYFCVLGVFLSVSRVFQGIMGCSRGVPGLFRGVPGVFRECSGVFRGCSGFYHRQPKLRLRAAHKLDCFLGGPAPLPDEV